MEKDNPNLNNKKTEKIKINKSLINLKNSEKIKYFFGKFLINITNEFLKLIVLLFSPYCIVPPPT